METFEQLGLIEPLQRAVAAENYHTPSEIQARAIPSILQGRDLLGCAQTGTGKTAAFSLPMLQLLSANAPQSGQRRPRALILSPTRELAAQIRQNIVAYSRFLPLKSCVIYGGVSEVPQIRDLKKGVDLLVATPGRFLDLYERGFIDLGAIEFLVLDEADRMLDMGFIHDIRRIIKVLPAKRQSLLFSATLPPSIMDLARGLLRDPVRVEVAPDEPTIEAIEQRLMFVDKNDKSELLVELLGSPQVQRSIVFTRTKHGANRLTQRLDKAGFGAVAIHGNKSQNARKRALDGFKDGTYNILVATDVASRGIDVDDVTHVFNYDLPDEPESYVHRIGRTGRAGRSGVAVSLCDTTEGSKLRDIERAIAQPIPQDLEHAYHCAAAVPAPTPAPREASGSAQSRRYNRGGGGGGGGGARGGQNRRGGNRGGGGQNRPRQRGGGGRSSGKRD